jgi:hypothetical protein
MGDVWIHTLRACRAKQALHQLNHPPKIIKTNFIFNFPAPPHATLFKKAKFFYLDWTEIWMKAMETACRDTVIIYLVWKISQVINTSICLAFYFSFIL